MSLAIDRLIFSTDVDTEITHTYLRLLGITVPKKAVSIALNSHPDSLLIMHSLNNAGSIQLPAYTFFSIRNLKNRL